MLWESERKANLPGLKFENFADALVDAVAPVKMRVGGYCISEGGKAVVFVLLTESRSSGIMLWEKLNAPRLGQGCIRTIPICREYIS